MNVWQKTQYLGPMVTVGEIVGAAIVIYRHRPAIIMNVSDLWPTTVECDCPKNERANIISINKGIETCTPSNRIASFKNIK